MKRNNLIATILSGALLLTIAGCGAAPATSKPSTKPTAAQQSGAPASKAPTVNPADVQIGILIPGSPTDGGFSQLAAESGRMIEEKYGYKVAVVEAATAETIRSEAEEMAAAGYKIVFGHGGQCSSPLAEISPDYPDTWFVTTGGTEIRDNQFPVCLCLEEGTYVAGIIAGMMTKTNVIGCSLGGDFPAYSKTTNAFELGAKSVNPDIKVMRAILSAPDPNEAYETTMNQIAAGADFIYSNTNEGQAGAMKAVNENEGVYGFGSLGDFISLAPDHVVANILGDWPKGFMMATEAVINGTTKPEIMFLTLDTGCVTLQWNEKVKATMPPEVIKAAEQAIQDINDGKIDVPNEYELNQ